MNLELLIQKSQLTMLTLLYAGFHRGTLRMKGISMSIHTASAQVHPNITFIKFTCAKLD